MSGPETGDLEDQAQRMRKMIERLDVDILELAYAGLGGVRAKASRTCSACENATECARWLDVALHSAERPTFCPNLPLFERFTSR
jgi:hypothetical protein